MKSQTSLRAALIAAVSLSAITMDVHASEIAADAFAPPQEIVVMTSDDAVAAPVADEAPATRNLLLGGAAAGILALLAKIIGFKRIRVAAGKAGPAIARAARSAVEVPGAAVRFVSSKVASPVKSLVVFASLGMTAFFGVGFYDVEWLGGLVIGAAMVAMTWAATGKLAQRPVAAKAMPNEAK